MEKVNDGLNVVENDFTDVVLFSRVGPWMYRDEFIKVYKSLFGEESTQESKIWGLEMLKIWRARRLKETPSSILSTLAILEVMLNDDTLKNDDQQRVLYSNAFTRFLNYMSSTIQVKETKSMYKTAKQLGIDTFIVDLRHLCAHGDAIPSLDFLRRTATYCLDWIEGFYWKRQLDIIEDATLDNIRQKRSIDFEIKIKDLFLIYDAATEALHKQCKYIEQVAVDGIISSEYRQILLNYHREHSIEVLSTIAMNTVDELVELACSESRSRGQMILFCDQLFNCKYLMGTATKYARNSSEDKLNRRDFIKLHQHLFQSLAICGFIEQCLSTLMQICEDKHDLDRCCGAVFWAKVIIESFLAFKEFKRLYKEKKEQDPTFELDISTVNSEILPNDIRKMYKSMGMKSKGILIFGDSIRRPWSISFSRKYLRERILNVNPLTASILKKCVLIAEPAFSQSEIDDLIKLIDFCVKNTSDNIAETANVNDIINDKIYTVSDVKQEVNGNANQEYCMDIASNGGTGDVREGDIDNCHFGKENIIGPWKLVNDSFNWKLCPLGSLPWQ